MFSIYSLFHTIVVIYIFLMRNYRTMLQYLMGWKSNHKGPGSCNERNVTRMIQIFLALNNVFNSTGKKNIL